jgi:hypothetical protein
MPDLVRPAGDMSRPALPDLGSYWEQQGDSGVRGDTGGGASTRRMYGYEHSLMGGTKAFEEERLRASELCVSQPKKLLIEQSRSGA